MRFFEDESCGQCTPCRVGTQKARMLMERGDWDAALLEELAPGDARRLDLRARPGGDQSADLACMRYFPELLSPKEAAE